MLDYIPDEEVKNYFSAADLVILPYKEFEAQSGVGSISVSFGKPLLVSDAGGLPDLVDGKYVFKAGNIDDMSKKIVDVFKNDMLGEMRKQATSKKKELSWDTIISKTVEIYKKLAEV